MSTSWRNPEYPPTRAMNPPVPWVQADADGHRDLATRAPNTQTDFDRRYPPDSDYRRGLDVNARVWKVYRGEATENDDAQIQIWDNTINILLTFAGLFSATVTAFAIDAYKFFLPNSPIAPSARAKWVNGLWFTSLFFSLGAAFLCILLKQWLDEYRARTRGPASNARHWARRHRFYAAGRDDWCLAAYISILPLLLHIALFLFLSGIVLLLWPLVHELAIFLASLTGFIFVVYVLTTFTPLFVPAFPTGTSLLRDVGRGFMRLGNAVLPPDRFRWLLSVLGLPEENAQRLSDNLPLITPFDQRLEKQDANNQLLPQKLDIDALAWLFSAVPEGDASFVACQALGALAPSDPLTARIRERPSIREHVTWDLLRTPGLSAAASCGVMRSILVVRPDDQLVKTIEAGILGLHSDMLLSCIVRLVARVSLACDTSHPGGAHSAGRGGECNEMCLVTRVLHILDVPETLDSPHVVSFADSTGRQSFQLESAS